MSATAKLLDFAYQAHKLPAGVKAAAERLLRDTLAVGAAGSTAPGAEAVERAARAWGSGSAARLLGTPGRLPAAGAAFVNGFRIHCLEWDAVHEPAVVHAMSVVTAALGAAIDARGGCDPRVALTALAVGVDVASGLGLAASGPLRFFRPAIAGTIGASLAVARIAGIPRNRLSDVIGLAHAACAGTMQAHVEGSIALPLQIANAARAAVAAVDLVEAGLSGPHDALEGPFGHFELFDEGNLETYTRDLGQVWRICEISTKPYPSGRASHGVLGTLEGVAGSHDITAYVPPLVARLVGRMSSPDMTPSQARLCLPFLAALMLREGRIDPRRFTPEVFADRDLQATAASITVKSNGNLDPNALSPQRLVIDEREVHVQHALGNPEAPLSPQQIHAKLSLARELAPNAEQRIFDHPIAYFANLPE